MTLELEFIKEWIIDTIQDRLEEDGETSDGETLRTNSAISGKEGFYSKRTEQIKKAKGQKTSNVTLKDSGKFYESFKVAANSTFISLKANFNKSDGNIFDNFTRSFTSEQDFESSILSLSDSEMDIFIEKIFYPEFMMFLKRGVNQSLREI